MFLWNSFLPAFLINLFAAFAFFHCCNKIRFDATRHKLETRGSKFETGDAYAQVVFPKRARFAVASHFRSLRDLGFGNNAATNAGEDGDPVLGTVVA